MINLDDLVMVPFAKAAARAGEMGMYVFNGIAASNLALGIVNPLPRRMDPGYYWIKNASTNGSVLTVSSSDGAHFFTGTNVTNFVLQQGESCLIAYDGTLFEVLGNFPKAAITSTPGDPTGTTSATAVMMGLAGTITPTTGIRAHFAAMGQMANSVISDGATVQLRYGTGTAPTNGAAVTGTQVGAAQTMTSLVAAMRSGFSIGGSVSGLAPGTAYWFDIAILAVTAGTATVTGVTLDAYEM